MSSCSRQGVARQADSAAPPEPERIGRVSGGDGRCSIRGAGDSFPTIQGKAPSYYLSDLAGMRMLVLKHRQGDRIRINDTTELIVLEIHFGQVTIAIAPLRDHAAKSPK